MTTAPVVELESVAKVYPGPPPVRAVDGVDLAVAAGELVAVVGPSGSGKSTLLHLMGGLDRPTAGAVRIEGQDIARLPDRRLAALRAHRIGFVFQDFFLLDGVTALDNVAQGLLYRRVPARVRRERARTVLTRVGLGSRLGHVPAQLSGGERQRVAIARALVGEPAFVLADEPTGNLDTASSDAIVALLGELNGAGATIVVITHDLEVASRFPRRVEMRDGRITAGAAR